MVGNKYTPEKSFQVGEEMSPLVTGYTGRQAKKFSDEEGKTRTKKG